MHIYLRKDCAKLYTNVIWNNGALGIFDQAEEWSPQQEQDK